MIRSARRTGPSTRASLMFGNSAANIVARLEARIPRRVARDSGSESTIRVRRADDIMSPWSSTFEIALSKWQIDRITDTGDAGNQRELFSFVFRHLHEPHGIRRARPAGRRRAHDLRRHEDDQLALVVPE